MDKAEVAKQKYIYVLVDSLEIPTDTCWIKCLPLESCVSSSYILHTVDSVLRQLDTKRENLALLLTDADRYISLAGKILEELYPSLMRITCTAHLLHNCVVRGRAYFKNIDDV